ncbi:hypothetical protein, partial [Sphingobium yanoikuyae]|uniref:hypothetical protein n=1 Tax=Sphingobium yanoikuyae TaxID=13690 RepID=UPI001BDEC83D
FSMENPGHFSVEINSDIGILKSGRGSKDFERTLGHPRTTQVEGCRSHAQKALSQSQSDA